MLRQRYSLSMLHRTCEYVQGGVRLGRLGMPNILHMPFYFKPRGIKKYSIHIWCKLSFPVFLLKRGVVNPYVDGFFNCSGSAMVLSLYYLEVVLGGSVASSASVAVYRVGSL